MYQPPHGDDCRSALANQGDIAFEDYFFSVGHFYHSHVDEHGGVEGLTSVPTVPALSGVVGGEVVVLEYGLSPSVENQEAFYTAHAIVVGTDEEHIVDIIPVGGEAIGDINRHILDSVYTAGFMTSLLLERHEKMAWMLRAHLE